jgi:hypothetical protein
MAAKATGQLGVAGEELVELRVVLGVSSDTITPLRLPRRTKAARGRRLAGLAARGD